MLHHPGKQLECIMSYLIRWDERMDGEMPIDGIAKRDTRLNSGYLVRIERAPYHEAHAALVVNKPLDASHRKGKRWCREVSGRSIIPDCTHQGGYIELGDEIP